MKTLKPLKMLSNAFLRFLRKKRSVITSTVTSVASVVLAIFATEFYKWLSGTLESENTAPAKIFVLITLILATIFMFFVIACIAEFIKHLIWRDDTDDRYMKHAFLHIKELGANRQESFQEHQNALQPQNATDFMVDEAVRNMQLVVQSCFNFFNSAFSETGQLVDNIKFESTFMTRSYIDQEITIPCSANKENRTPISMLQREENPKIFENTETAKIYGMTRPAMILIEDTSTNGDYVETYQHQKERIKSSVILPVLSHRNELLGTLVVHCNQARFFRRSRYAFWMELLEIFSVELGYHKLLLDYYIENNPTIEKPF